MVGIAHLLWPLALLLPADRQAVPPTQTAQTAPATPGPDATPADDLTATTIALAMIDSRMTVPVQIAGAGPYRFVIDTGAERTVISRELAGNLRLTASTPVNVTAMSGTSLVSTVMIPSITMSSVPDVGAIRAPALGAIHLGALGLLGIDTLRNHRVDIDFEAGTMTVRPSVKRIRREEKLPGEIVVRAKSLYGQLIVTEASYENQPIRVIIDTGSPLSVGNTPMRRLLGPMAWLKPLELVSATGGIVNTRYALVDRLRVGDVEFSDMPVAFADVAPFKRFGLERKPAMFLGMGALKFFRRVQIDFPNREVRFQMPHKEHMAGL